MRFPGLAMLLLAGAAQAQVTKTTTMVTVPNCGAASAASEVDVYRPTGVGPFPLVSVGHGFQNSKDNYAGLAQALGAAGIVVVVPQFPSLLSACGADHARNARVMIAAMDQQITAGGIDTTKLGFAGHSAGGLAAFLAAAQRPVAAVVLYDPVENSNLGTPVASTVASPTLFLFAEPATCNSQGNAVPWFTAMPGPKARLKVVNANHCDPQEPISGICTFGCGGAAATSTVRSAIFKRYAVDFFERYLLGQTMPCLEATAQTDATAGTITAVDFRLGGCGAVDAGVDAGVPVDAGTPVDAGLMTDAGPTVDAGVDAGQPIDAGTVDDAGIAGTDAGITAPADAGEVADAGANPVAPPTGCGCSVSDAWGLLSLAPLLLVRARRRARSAGW
ncbi:MAG: hypothetical protein Q8L48_28975 [Archangium sp.]|nr:hypothetical protein [Archangium sp.]